MLTLAIDPGAHQGWAIFEHTYLLACGIASPPAIRMQRVVIERQAIYPNSPVAPEDILTLALRAGEAAGLYALSQSIKPEYVLPRTWKGSSKKHVSHQRIWHRLGPNEHRVVSLAAECIPTRKQGDMLDAIGIGLWAIGRRA